MIEKGKEMQCQSGIGIILRRGAQNYSGVWLIAPIPDPNLIPIQDPCHISNWGDNIRGSYRSTILRTQLPSDRTWKMGPSIFAAISWIKFAITTRASFPNMPLKKKNKQRILFPLLVKILTILLLLFFLPPIQESPYCILVAWFIVWVPQSDVNILKVIIFSQQRGG